jgi:hypothetical protein
MAASPWEFLPLKINESTWADIAYLTTART